MAILMLIGGNAPILRPLFSVGAKVSGDLFLDNIDIYKDGIPTMLLRSRIGVVFPRPNPFPTLSIYNYGVSGLRFNGVRKKSPLDEAAESALISAARWDSVSSRLKTRSSNLSGGEQQRLCIARALAVAREILLLDESAAAPGPVSTQHIEELMAELKNRVTMVIVTHNMQQAARISDECAFLLMAEDRAGELIEFAATSKIFNDPSDARTMDYVQGRFG